MQSKEGSHRAIEGELHSEGCIGHDCEDFWLVICIARVIVLGKHVSVYCYDEGFVVLAG